MSSIYLRSVAISITLDASVDPPIRLSVMEILSDHLWLHIKREARVSSRMSAAIAYITDASAFLPRSDDSLIVVNASDRALEAGSTDPRVLRIFMDAGVKLYSSSNLHAKAIAFDRSAFIGSMNASRSSQDRLIECALLIKDSSLVSQTHALVSELATDAMRIDAAFLDRAMKIYASSTTLRKVEPLSTAQRQFWYLEKCPHTSSRNLRAYFVALIVAQLNDFKENEAFALWPNLKNLSQHLPHRLQKSGTRYVLTSLGVDYFSSYQQWPEPARLERFLRAVKTGDETALPEDLEFRSLKPFYV